MSFNLKKIRSLALFLSELCSFKDREEEEKEEEEKEEEEEDCPHRNPQTDTYPHTLKIALVEELCSSFTPSAAILVCVCV